MKNHLAPEVKSKRTKALISAGNESARKFFERNSGTVRKVLFEEFHVEENEFIGYTDNYIKVYAKNGKSRRYKQNEFCRCYVCLHRTKME